MVSRSNTQFDSCVKLNPSHLQLNVVLPDSIDVEKFVEVSSACQFWSASNERYSPVRSKYVLCKRL